MARFFFTAVFVLSTWLMASTTSALHAQEPNNVIAKVGDQEITFTQIDTMINSSSLVGIGVPAVGSPERNVLRVHILDKIVTANLLYLDALKKGMDKNPVYRKDVQRFSDNTLAAVYRQRVLVGDVSVTDEEVQRFYDTRIGEGTEFTGDVRLAIEAKIRKAKFKERTADMRERLRKGVVVTVDEKALDREKDAERSVDTVVATIDGKPVTWGDVKAVVTHPSKVSAEKRLEALNKHIDTEIMVIKAREMGLEKDPVYQARMKEFKKVRLVNIHRGKLVDEMAPSDQEVREYYKKNRARIAVPEKRKIQMVVLKTKKEAKEVKKKIKSGEITMYEVARDYSIHPNAKKDLGEIGWVSEGTGFPELSKMTFSLKPGEVGGPVESPAGWHLVMVLDNRKALNQDVEDKDTWKETRRMFIKEKIDRYAVSLRLHEFNVEVYEDVLNLNIEQEAETLKEWRKAVAEPSEPQEEAVAGKDEDGGQQK
jgi:hypothetical protein